jgi:hypothetical protein
VRSKYWQEHCFMEQRLGMNFYSKPPGSPGHGNRAARRRARAEARKFLQEFHEDSGGCFRWILIRRNGVNHAWLIAGVEMGDPAVWSVAARLNQMAANIMAGIGPVCFICGTGLTAVPDVVGVMIPYRPDPVRFLTCGLCQACERLSDAEIEARATEVLRGTWGPDLHMVDPVHISPEGGSA